MQRQALKQTYWTFHKPLFAAHAHSWFIDSNLGSVLSSSSSSSSESSDMRIETAELDQFDSVLELCSKLSFAADVARCWLLFIRCAKLTWPYYISGTSFYPLDYLSLADIERRLLTAKNYAYTYFLGLCGVQFINPASDKTSSLVSYKIFEKYQKIFIGNGRWKCCSNLPRVYGFFMRPIKRNSSNSSSIFMILISLMLSDPTHLN